MLAADEIRLAVPATPEFLRLARLTASGVASRMGFSFDEVEDLRLALDELCFALIGPSGRPGLVELHYSVVDAALEVEGIGAFEHDPGTSGSAPGLSDFSTEILAALVDEHRLYRDDEGQPRFRMVKRRSGDRS